MLEDRSYPQMNSPATKADVVDAILVMQQIASELADALLASESDDRQAVLAAMKQYLVYMRDAGKLIDRLAGNPE
ncbi:hypothetical protein [Sphingomonas adhaesiva]|uniref:hypothetical protein n=1 Tax=Sphingomonas adhaesiva TaxID=28212 RepID=UPI002FF7B0D0